MKKLLILLFSLFFLSSHSIFANDISDFKIEGMGIGDSLLDFIDRDKIIEEIEKTKNSYSYLKEPNKFVEVYLRNDFPMYDIVSVFIKNNSPNQFIINDDDKFIILAIRGMTKYNQEFDSCLMKRNEIIEVVSNMFPNTQRMESVYDSPLDKSGNSIYDAVNFEFDSGNTIYIYCNDWEENFRIKNNYFEGLTVGIFTEDVNLWGSDY